MPNGLHLVGFSLICFDKNIRYCNIKKVSKQEDKQKTNKDIFK